MKNWEKINFFFFAFENAPSILPFFGSPLKIRNDFSAFCGRPFDASQVGVSGMGINMINATMHMEQLMALTRRQFVYRGKVEKIKIGFKYVDEVNALT